MEAKEGIVLDQHGSVIYEGSGPQDASAGARTAIAWGARGIVPKIILAVAVSTLLFFGLGIVTLVLGVMLLSLILRTVIGAITGNPRRRSDFTFIVRR